MFRPGLSGRNDSLTVALLAEILKLRLFAENLCKAPPNNLHQCIRMMTMLTRDRKKLFQFRDLHQHSSTDYRVEVSQLTQIMVE